MPRLILSSYFLYKTSSFSILNKKIKKISVWHLKKVICWYKQNFPILRILKAIPYLEIYFFIIATLNNNLREFETTLNKENLKFIIKNANTITFFFFLIQSLLRAWLLAWLLVRRSHHFIILFFLIRIFGLIRITDSYPWFSLSRINHSGNKSIYIIKYKYI